MMAVARSTRLLTIWFALGVLIAHTLITACVPAPLLLLSQHDHLVIGKVSAEQWAAHMQWHLHELNHHYTPTQPDPAVATGNTGIILSVEGCDMNALQAFYVTVRGTTPQIEGPGNIIAITPLPPLLEAHGHAAPLRVPCPPPRLL